MHSIDFIRCHLPTLVLAENVEAFSKKHKQVMEEILEILRQLGYEVTWKVLNTKNYGIPQSRSRWYMVAVLATQVRNDRCLGVSMDNVFPEPLAEGVCIPLEALITPLPEDQWLALPKESEKATDVLARTNVQSFLEKVASQGVNPYVTPCVVDAGSSERFSTGMIRRCPCLTRNRCSGFGY